MGTPHGGPHRGTSPGRGPQQGGRPTAGPYGGDTSAGNARTQDGYAGGGTYGNGSAPPPPSSSASPPRLPRTYPLATVGVEEAVEIQFRLLAHTARHFEGPQLFESDAGVVPGLGRPRTTARVEAVLAGLLGGEAAALVQGAGTGAVRAALGAVLNPGDRLLIHRAPLYRTTAATLRGLGLRTVAADFNDPSELTRLLASGRFSCAYVQHSRQRLGDSYDPGEVLAACGAAGVRTVVDDNYTAFRVPACGAGLGADASCFSLFKLHGPEGVGAVVGTAEVVERVHRDNYSGGGQVQGHQALDALRALTHVPVMWAVQSRTAVRAAERLAAGEVPGVAEVRLANVQDLCLILRLDRPVARGLPAAAARYGAASYPVGSGSRYELAPLFYRLSSTCLEEDPRLADWAVRINPMRAGEELTLDILRRALHDLSGSTDGHEPRNAPGPPATSASRTPRSPDVPRGAAGRG